MTNRNRIGLTWISFFSYALTGALVIVTGMVLDNIAQYFQLPISEMSNTFTFLNAGILAAVFLNAWLMVIVPLKRQLIFGFVLMILAVAGLMTSHNLTVFSLCMFVLGVVSGITMSIGTFLITHLYDGRQRGSRLLFTDSFFSMAGTIFPIIAGILLARALPWYWVYACIGVIYVAIFILTLMVDFVVRNAREASLGSVELNVNKHNDAIQAYEKLGFRRVRAEKNDIGSGYFMDDYVYALNVDDWRSPASGREVPQ